MKVNEEKQREWQRALRRFKKGVRLRAKLGLIETLCKQVAQERKRQTKWLAPEWDDDRWLTALYVSIRDNRYPIELLKGFVETAEITFFSPVNQPTVEAVLAAVDDVCRRYSKDLRRKFGVFEEDKR